MIDYLANIGFQKKSVAVANLLVNTNIAFLIEKGPASQGIFNNLKSRILELKNECYSAGHKVSEDDAFDITRVDTHFGHAETDDSPATGLTKTIQ